MDALAVGIWGQLLTKAAAAAPTFHLTMALCSPWHPGRKTHPAQPRPPTKRVTWDLRDLQVKQDGG